jgi:predicted metal-dependent enzyme (double-stranded beta helix superfamily)/mannose-6-phosphate isomerase-like protein (cupin superfamily)
MPAEFINILDLPELEIGHSKKVLFSSEHFHTWIHGDYPGTKGPMHKHTADQQFYCIKGECTFHFPDGSARKLLPGMLVTIPAGQLYQLDNTGDEYMILLGARAEPAAKPRFSPDDHVVGSGDYALKNLDKIRAPENKKARARVLSAPNRLPVFEKFIQELRAVWAAVPDTESRMRRGAKLLEDLVKDESLRAHSRSWPSTEGRKNLLFYEDPEYHFAINGVVRVPGRKGSIHDHAHAWTAYGVLDGSETLQRFRRLDGGQSEGRAELKLESVSEGIPGKVDLVPPFAIHAEQGGPVRSVAVILRSERVAGKTTQGSYDPEKRTVRQIEGPTQVPFEIV